MATILAIDDVLHNLVILKHGLEDEGHRVLMAESGSQGLEIIESHDPDLVLLDIGMPEMDGHEVLRRLRESEAYKELPVIILTADTMDQNLARCLAAGANDYVTKPFSFTALSARIKAALRASESYQRLKKDVRDLRDLAATDPLTGVFNRRGFMEKCEVEFQRTVRARLDLSVAMIDLDHFKRVNDQFGHHGGDHVLREFGALLKRTFRVYDIVGRMGGEEFAVCMPDTKTINAYKRLEKLRKDFAAMEIVTKDTGEAMPVTISVGIATYTDHHSVENLFILADMALYRAKTQGRNRTIVETGVTTGP